MDNYGELLTRPVVHILLHGLPLCRDGSLPHPPGLWHREQHVWVTTEDYDECTCEGCLEAYDLLYVEEA